MAQTKWTANVGMFDTDTGNQIGEYWLVEVEAADAAEARTLIRKAAWDEVDSRINDVRLELLDLWDQGSGEVLTGDDADERCDCGDKIGHIAACEFRRTTKHRCAGCGQFLGSTPTCAVCKEHRLQRLAKALER